MAKIICIANQKGGVGKTSVTSNIAVALTLQGKKVLMVDLDSQCSLTMSFGYDPESFETSAVSMLENPKVAPMCIYETDIEGLSFIPSSAMLSTAELLLSKKSDSNTRLKKGLEIVSKLFDYILIDCSPSLAPSTLNALVATDYVLIPAETKTSSNYSLNVFITTINAIKANINDKLEILGVVATMYNCQANEDKQILAELQDTYEVLGIIKRTTAVSSAFSKGKPSVLTSRRSVTTQEFKGIADKIIKKVEVQ